MSSTVVCNACQKTMVPTSEPQMVVTSCTHLFCVSCATASFRDHPGRESCPKCAMALRDEDCNVVDQKPSKHNLKMALVGMTPENMIVALKSGMAFSAQQSKLSAEVGQARLAQLASENRELQSSNEHMAEKQKTAQQREATQAAELARLSDGLQQVEREKRFAEDQYKSLKRKSASSQMLSPGAPQRSVLGSLRRGSPSVSQSQSQSQSQRRQIIQSPRPGQGDEHLDRDRFSMVRRMQSSSPALMVQPMQQRLAPPHRRITGGPSSSAHLHQGPSIVAQSHSYPSIASQAYRSPSSRVHQQPSQVSSRGGGGGGGGGGRHRSRSSRLDSLLTPRERPAATPRTYH